MTKKPRIILAAGNFEDQEVTSCVLWLRNFGVDISCVEITPYRMPDGRIILAPRVIIPLPEAEAFIVGTEKKEVEEAKTTGTSWYRERNQQILDVFKQLVPGRMPRTALDKNYTQIPTRKPGVHFEWSFRGRGQHKRINVAIHFETASKEVNRQLCLAIGQQKEMLEEKLGQPVTVHPEWTTQWSSIYVDGECEPWDEAAIRWTAETMMKLMKASEPLLEGASRT